MGQKKFFREWLPRHRKNGLIKAIDKLAVSYHKKFINYNYDWEKNGESRVLSTLAECLTGDIVIFDVGANVGGWAATASHFFRACPIYSFEPIPATYKLLTERTKPIVNIKCYNMGLSDKPGILEFAHQDGSNTVSSAMPNAYESIHGGKPQLIQCTVSNGDLFCSENNIDRISFLKIDTEGYEGHVLDGFSEFIQQGKIKVIQIEYGKANIYSGFLLKDLYEKLEKNYVIGKIYPTSVEFKNYGTGDEDFVGPNFLAVLKTESELIAKLS